LILKPEQDFSIKCFTAQRLWRAALPPNHQHVIDAERKVRRLEANV
jgi:hypothetical protein